MSDALIRLGADLDRYAEGHDCDWLKPLVLRDYAKGEALHDICAKPGYPSVSAVMWWLDNDPEFAQFWIYAKRARSEKCNDHIASILDRMSSDLEEDPMSHTDVSRMKAALDGLFRLRSLEGGSTDPGGSDTEAPQHNHIHISARSGLDLSRFPPQNTPPAREVIAAEAEALPAPDGSDEGTE
jgi:hypothetical protein